MSDSSKRRDFYLLDFPNPQGVYYATRFMPLEKHIKTIHVREILPTDASREKVFDQAVMLLRAWRNSSQSEIHADYCDEDKEPFGACRCGLDERRKLSDNVLAAFERTKK